MAILEANGAKCAPILTRKRIRDKVCWSDGAETAWRRSPAWLVLRVGFQRSLQNLLGETVGSLHYKFFMSFVLASISQKICVDSSIPIDRLAFARTKLARRATKVQPQQTSATQQLSETIDSLFLTCEKGLDRTLREASEALTKRWNNIRPRAAKRVALLPRRADLASTTLSLFHSRRYRKTSWTRFLMSKGRPNGRFLIITTAPPIGQCGQRKRRGNFSVSDYLILGEVEAKASTMHPISEIETGGFTLEETCLESMRRLQHYERHTSSAYTSDPEQLSIMLVTILEMWQVLDTIALSLYPLLADYDPGFPSDLCYPLCSPKLADMQRLQNMEEHLKTRHDTATYPSYSVLGTLQRESFAIRHFDQCQDMQMLLADIDLADKMARVRKEKELIEKSSEYEALL